jgi:hypothetical protein
VPDRARALQLFELALTEDLRDQPHVFVNQKRFARAAAGDDSRAFLAAMLEGEQSVIRQDRGVLVAEHAEKPAFVLRIHLSLGEIVVLVGSDHTKTSTNRRPKQTAVVPSGAERSRGISHHKLGMPSEQVSPSTRRRIEFHQSS